MKPLKALLILVMLALLMIVLAVADEPIDGRMGRAEVRFLEGMIDHHQMALDMAENCLEKASTEKVKTLCERVISAQSAEIEMMRGWLADWYEIFYIPMSIGDMKEIDMGHGDMNMGKMATDPPMMMGMMAGFDRLAGIDYDIAWLESMIDHHDDALHMSERILSRAQHPELIDLANQIISDQSAEIEAMEMLLTALQ